jgi:hypothetical protein
MQMTAANWTRITGLASSAPCHPSRMVDLAVVALAELDCRDQDIDFEPQGLKSQTAWALAERLLLSGCRQAALLYPGHAPDHPV